MVGGLGEALETHVGLRPLRDEDFRKMVDDEYARIEAPSHIVPEKELARILAALKIEPKRFESEDE